VSAVTGSGTTIAPRPLEPAPRVSHEPRCVPVAVGVAIDDLDPVIDPRQFGGPVLGRVDWVLDANPGPLPGVLALTRC
jgi:hypothetical protein